MVEGFESLKGVDGIKVPQSQPCTIPIIHQTSFYLNITDVARWTLPMSITKFVNGLPKKNKNCEWNPGDFGLDSRKCCPNELAINLNFWFLPLVIFYWLWITWPSDGKTVGACLDRNGLRPARYWRTVDNIVYVASEVCLFFSPTHTYIWIFYYFASNVRFVHHFSLSNWVIFTHTRLYYLMGYAFHSSTFLLLVFLCSHHWLFYYHFGTKMFSQ